MIKQIVFAFFAIALAITNTSCDEKEKERPSPLRSDSTTIDSSNLKIEFGSPAVRERAIWGELVPFDKIWRTGANEATRLTTTKGIKINGVTLDSGKYSLFTIPREDEWTLILNENHKLWGTSDYDSTLDVLRVNILTRQTKEFSERLKFYFEDDSLKFHWKNLGFSLSLE
ncbi:MAG: DUF2911 domain-containing protein [Cytophagales bacterium]|nr:DUF2911 domain-containing protein [Cytophagales bacterium]